VPSNRKRRPAMATRNLEELPIFDGDEVNVVETSKGQRFKYDSEHGLF
jgi:hypothetical protein